MKSMTFGWLMKKQICFYLCIFCYVKQKNNVPKSASAISINQFTVFDPEIDSFF